MTHTVKRVTTFRVDVADEPGVAAGLARKLREAEVNLLGLWGYGMGSGRASIYMVPEKADALRRAAGLYKFHMMEGTAFLVQGADRLGALCETLEILARAGVNVHAVSGVVSGEQFGSLLWSEEQDAKRVGELLGAG